MLDLLIPLILIGVAVFGLWKKQNVYECLLEGGMDGLRLLLSIIPALVVLLTGVHMLRASGAMEILSDVLSPLFSFFGIPPETAMLVLVRPISGSAALAVGSELMAQYGVNSQIGRTAAVMLGSTETTFYTIAVYFGAAGIKKSRYAVPAALCADLAGFFFGALTVRILFG
jgi:spore maturation protein B